MIAHLSKPLHADSEASKCTPTISILTPPLSSGLFFPLIIIRKGTWDTRNTNQAHFPSHASLNVTTAMKWNKWHVMEQMARLCLANVC